MTKVWNATEYKLQEKAMQELGPMLYAEREYARHMEGLAWLVLVIVLSVVGYAFLFVH